MEFTFIYIDGCLSACQNQHSSGLQNTLYAIPVTTFVFTNVPIDINGILEIVPQIEFISILYVSPICKILF
jgi:hypothetical protein